MLTRGGQGTAEYIDPFTLPYESVKFVDPVGLKALKKIHPILWNASSWKTRLELFLSYQDDVLMENPKERIKRNQENIKRAREAEKASYTEVDEDKNPSYPQTSQDTNGSYPDDEPIIRKKRVTAKDVMSEQQMFQEEHLKLAERVTQLQARVQNQGLTIKRVVSLLHTMIRRFDEHVSLDSYGATVAANTISLHGNSPDNLIWDSTDDPDCNCPDNLDCPVHPKK